VLGRGKAIWDEEGNPVRMIGSHADTTERKRAEEQLYYQASHDFLTGLANRGQFLSQLEDKIEMAHVGGNTICLCVCDIDHFKSVNDAFGHQCGDDVLVTLGKILKEGIRSTDLAARMGGDEFYILFTATTVAQTDECLDRIRCRLEAVRFGRQTGTVFRATASFGLASLIPGMNSKDLIEAADNALYEAKRQGRNTISWMQATFAQRQHDTIHEVARAGGHIRGEG
jgi:diguanylate cyclase (GGDEF)-like protein